MGVINSINIHEMIMPSLTINRNLAYTINRN